MRRCMLLCRVPREITTNFQCSNYKLWLIAIIIWEAFFKIQILEPNLDLKNQNLASVIHWGPNLSGLRVRQTKITNRYPLYRPASAVTQPMKPITLHHTISACIKKLEMSIFYAARSNSFYVLENLDIADYVLENLYFFILYQTFP